MDLKKINNEIFIFKMPQLDIGTFWTQGGLLFMAIIITYIIIIWYLLPDLTLGFNQRKGIKNQLDSEISKIIGYFTVIFLSLHIYAGCKENYQFYYILD